MKTPLVTAGAMALILSAIGCTAQARSPEPVPLDRVECSRCRMLISTERGAGQIVSADEDTRFYDDIGCLAADWLGLTDEAVPYVHVSAGEWQDARTAVYANRTAATTPMGSGLVAFGSEAEADIASPGSRVSTWNEVIGALVNH